MNPLSLADVPPQEIHWLWPGRIPLGKITLLVGDPGVGKSLVALDIAARVSTGAPWPDEPLCGLRIADCELNPPNPQFEIRNSQLPARPSTVLLLTAEDDLADTVRPRLEAAGADCSRILTPPPGWSPDDPKGDRVAELCFPDLRPHAEVPPPPRPFDLRHDVRFLDGMLIRRDCRLLVIDPVSAYLGRNIDNGASDAHHMLAPLAALAARRNMAVVVVSRLRRRCGSAIQRTAGSLASAAAARNAWLVVPDPHQVDRRLLLPVKNNLGTLAGGLSFAIAPAAPGEPPRIQWSSEPPTQSADEALRAPVGRPSHERDDAIRWLQNALAKGARPSVEVQREAEAAGLQRITVRRAFRELGGEAVHQGFGVLSQWCWRLPGVGDPNPAPTLDHLWMK